MLRSRCLFMQVTWYSKLRSNFEAKHAGGRGTEGLPPLFPYPQTLERTFGSPNTSSVLIPQRYCTFKKIHAQTLRLSSQPHLPTGPS
ncbi:hypothetical protein TNCV_2268041 [Trichonephila clavipes]|nr:hypothetical protein TNCV_2268041 [Trichonephila clavipes]